jgi:hypothetical protein
VVSLLQPSGFVSPVLKDKTGNDMYVTNRIWIVLPTSLSSASKTSILKGIQSYVSDKLVSSPKPVASASGSVWGGVSSSETSGYELYAVTLNTTDGMTVLNEVERLAKVGSVLAVEPDTCFIGYTNAVPAPNDPFWSQMWHMEQSNNFDIDALVFFTFKI